MSPTNNLNTPFSSLFSHLSSPLLHFLHKIHKKFIKTSNISIFFSYQPNFNLKLPLSPSFSQISLPPSKNKSFLLPQIPIPNLITNHFIFSSTMPLRTPVDFMNIVFKEGMNQHQRYATLYRCQITMTRYSDDSYLCSLGMFDNVCFMLNTIGWTHFVNLRHPTYEWLTLEFLDSYSYVMNPLSQNSIETIRFLGCLIDIMSLIRTE